MLLRYYVPPHVSKLQFLMATRWINVYGDYFLSLVQHITFYSITPVPRHLCSAICQSGTREPSSLPSSLPLTTLQPDHRHCSWELGHQVRRIFFIAIKLLKFPIFDLRRNGTPVHARRLHGIGARSLLYPTSSSASSTHDSGECSSAVICSLN